MTEEFRARMATGEKIDERTPVHGKSGGNEMLSMFKCDRALQDFYSGYDEEGRLASRHGSVEFLTTMRYIARYLKPGSRVCEIGAGTGRYSHALARQGHVVEAVELVKHNIDVFRRNTLPGEAVTVVQGNALDLSMFSDSRFDLTLLLGPLYHLKTREERLQALREAIRVTKADGVVFAAYVISDGCLLEGFAHNGVSQDDVHQGLIDGDSFAVKSDPKGLFRLERKEDVDGLLASLPAQRLHYVATDGCALILRDAIADMSDKAFDLYLKYHFATCERADMVGVTCHAVDIFRKQVK